MKEYTFDKELAMRIYVISRVVFQSIEEDIPQMLPVINRMLNDLEDIPNKL